MKKTSKKSTLTIGIDLGDKSHRTCAIDAQGEVVARTTLANDRDALTKFSEDNEAATIIIEAGCHSPWIDRLFSKLGHKVVVANPRKLRAIYETDNKSDERDAEMLARIGRLDGKLLHAVKHSSEKAQRALKIMDTRDTLVATRVRLVNSVRGSLKSLGVILESGWSTEAFARKATEALADEDYDLVQPLIEVIADLTIRIRDRDRRIQSMIANDYKEADRLQVVAGVGPVTALSFVLTVGDSKRFDRNREVGPFLGLVPKRDQSGDSDKPLRITKAGSKTLRRLLVNCAQYILGSFGPPCALRDAGMRICEGRGKTAKRKAVVAVARKLAVLLLALWKNPQSNYEPFPKAAAAAA